MQREFRVICEGSIGQIRDGLGGSGEVRWGIDPPHQKCQGESDHGLFIACGRKSNAYCWDVTGQQSDAIESVGCVYFADVDRAGAWMRLNYHAQEAVHSPAKLHGLGWGPRRCVVVHIEERVVHDGTWAEISLRDDSDRADSELAHVAYQPGWQDGQLPLLDHGGRLLPKKDNVLFGGQMSASLDRGLFELLGPWKIAHGDWDSAFTVLLKETRCWVVKIVSSIRY
jgi:hypothetical protein